MKRLTLMAGVLALALTGIWAVNAQTKGANFAGTWALDKAKSELPPMMQNIDSMSWIVTQDATQITRETKVEAGAAAPPGGGGRGMMGGGRPVTFKLDGSETVVDNPRGKAVHKVKWLDDGKVLEISTVNTFDMQGETVTMNGMERWELADGGATLKVWQKRESPRGTTESKMVFTKK